MDMQGQEKQAEIGPEEQARSDSMAAIQSQVTGAEGVSADGAQGGVSGGVAVVEPDTEARELIRFGVALFVPLYPSLAAVYTEQRQDQLAAVSAPLMAKYNLSLGAIFERWGAEINFALVAFPLAGETLKAIRADNAERKRLAELAAAEADQRKREGAGQ